MNYQTEIENLLALDFDVLKTVLDGDCVASNNDLQTSLSIVGQMMDREGSIIRCAKLKIIQLSLIRNINKRRKTNG